MSEKKKYHELTITDLIAKAPGPENPDLYANHAQIVVSGNEVFIDLYFISPHHANAGEVIAAYRQRVILPHPIVKGFATALVNAVANFEAETNILLPNQREHQPEDKITIWRQDEPESAL